MLTLKIIYTLLILLASVQCVWIPFIKDIFKYQNKILFIVHILLVLANISVIILSYYVSATQDCSTGSCGALAIFFIPVALATPMLLFTTLNNVVSMCRIYFKSST